MFRRTRIDADAALRRFDQQERGYLDRVRAEHLDDDMRRFGARHVEAHTYRSGGTRAVIDVGGDGPRLTVWLYWKSSLRLVELGRVYFHDEVGWLVLGRDAAGELARLIAYRIRVDVVAPARTTARPDR